MSDFIYSFYEFLQLIPTEFVEHYIPKEHLENKYSQIIGFIGKACQISLWMDQPLTFFLFVAGHIF
jgi:hypothetical protein